LMENQGRMVWMGFQDHKAHRVLQGQVALQALRVRRALVVPQGSRGNLGKMDWMVFQGRRAHKGVQDRLDRQGRRGFLGLRGCQRMME
jgi:hypothetical protein